MNHPMKTALTTGIAGLKTVSDIGLLPPGFALVAGVVNAIVQNCDQVKTHKKECKIIKAKAGELYDLLEKQTKDLVGTPLEDSVKDVKELTLISTRLQKFASWGFIQAFRYDAHIAGELRKSTEELDSSISSFKMSGLIYIANQIGGKGGINERLDALQIAHETAPRVVVQAKLILAGAKGVEALGMSGPQLNQFYGEGVEEVQALSRELSDANSNALATDNRTHDPIAEKNVFIDIVKGASAVHDWLRKGPPVANLNNIVVRRDPVAVAGGVATDIYKGTLLGKNPVAIKAVRTTSNRDETLEKRVRQELNLWRYLEHENILTFLGICTNLGSHLCLISDWHENGNLLKYCQKNANANRLQLLTGAARGVAYLHGKQIVHGNLKCSKILIDSEETALVSDFQMAKVLNESMSTGVSVTIQASARWSAPEYGSPMNAHPPADVYSFSMTMLECFILERPFNTPQLKREAAVTTHVASGGRPPRPIGNPWVTNRLWALMEDCWQGEWEKRPSMVEVIRRLEEIERDRMNQ